MRVDLENSISEKISFVDVSGKIDRIAIGFLKQRSPEYITQRNSILNFFLTLSVISYDRLINLQQYSTGV